MDQPVFRNNGEIFGLEKIDWKTGCKKGCLCLFKLKKKARVDLPCQKSIRSGTKRICFVLFWIENSERLENKNQANYSFSS